MSGLSRSVSGIGGDPSIGYEAEMVRALLILLGLLFGLGAAVAQEAPSFPAFATDAFVCSDDPSPAPAQPEFDETGCTRMAVNDIDPQGRVIWVRTRVMLPARSPSDPPLAALIGAMAASELYVNGERVGANGEVGATADAEIAGRMDATIFLPPEVLVEGENLLALRMSGHQGFLRVGVPVHFIAVDRYQDLGASRLRYYLPALVAAGALLLAAIYFFASYVSDARQRSALFLALMAVFAVGQMGAEATRGLLAYTYVWHVPRLILVGAFAGAFAIALVGFVVSRFQVARPVTWIGATAAIIVVLAPFAPGFDGKALAALLIGAVVSLAALSRRALRGGAGPRFMAAGLVLFSALILTREALFLDRDFFLFVSALMGALFVDQILTMRRDRAAREAAQARSTLLELELLRRGIAPHFLMNALNSLAEWVESDPPTAARMIEALGEQMRALGAIGQRDLIPLAEEIELVNSFLAVISYRTDASFSLEEEGAPARLMIPPGILHTLTENAFSHGRYPSGGLFHLKATVEDGVARLTFDAPPPQERRSRKGGGEGHAYVEGRLRAAFGDAARFTAAPLEDGGWRNTIEFTARTS